MKFTIFLYAATLFFFLDDISAQRQPLRPETTIEVTSKRPLSRGRAKFSATPEYKEASDDIQNVKKTRKNPESFEYNPSREERPNERKYEVQEVLDDIPNDRPKFFLKPRVITETKFEARNAPPKSFLFEPSSTTPEESPEELLKNFGPNSDKFLVPSKQQTEETLLKLDIPVERVRSTEAPKEVPSPIVSLSSSTPSLSSPLPSSLENEKENSSEGKDIVKNVSESNEEISVETLKTPLLFQETPSSTKRAEVASSTPSIQKSIFDAKQAQNVRAQATRIQGRGRASNANTTPKQNTVTAAPSRRQRTRPTRPPHSSTTTSTEKSQANFRRGSRRRGETTTIPSREKKDIHERNFSILDLINPEEQTEKIRAGRKIRAESREEDLASNPRRRVESRRRAPTPPSNLNANEVTPKPVSRRGHARRLESNEKITSQENKRVDVSRRQEIKKETAERKVSSETPRRGSHRSNQEQVKVTTEESPRQRQPVRTRGGRKQEVTASVPSGSGNEIPPRRRNQPVRNSQETRTEVRGRSSSRGSPRASPTEKSAPSRTVIRKRVESKKVAENSPERITVDLTTAKAVENEITTRKIEEETAKNTQNAELLKHKLDAEIQASTENTKNEASNEQIKKIEEDIVKQAAEANLLEKALEENLEQKVETRNSRITSRGSNRGKAEQEPIKASGRESVRRSPASRSREIKKENNEPRSVSGRDARRNTSRQTNSVRTTVNNNSPKTPSSSDDVNKKEIVRGNRSKSKFNPLEYDANKVEEEPFAGGKKLTTRTTRRTIGRGRGRPKFDDLEAATTDQVKISVQRVEAPSTTPSTAKFNTVSVEVGAPPSVTRVEERSSVAKTTPTPRTTVKESVQVSQVTEVVSKKKIGRKTLRKKIVSTPSPKSAVTVSVKVDEPIVTVSQVITRGTKKAAVENKKGSSEEIDESDNYPEPFKALIKAKEKQEKNHKESSRPTAKPSSLLGKKISKTVTSTSSSPPKTESFTTRSSTSTTSTSTTTTTQKNTIEADNEVVENNKGRKPFPTRRRFSLSTKKPLKKGGEETTKPPRTTTTKRTGALPTRAKLLQKYQDKGNKQKFHARFNSVSEDKPEESSVKPSGFIPKPTRSYKKATPRSVQETVVHSTQVPVSALSAKKSSRYSSRYRSDTSSRSSPARTTSIPAYIPTVPTVTPSNAVRGVHTEDNPAEGLHIISFDDPVNSISSDSLINGEYLSPAHKAKSGSISLSGQLNVAQYLPGIPNQNAVTFVPGSTPKSMPVPKVQDKPSSIIETIINSISSIPTTTSSDKLTTVTNAAPTQGSAILKLVRDDADIVDAFTTEKPTTIIERILSSLSAIQADGGAKNVESQNDIAPPEIPRFVASTTTVSTSSSPTTISTVNNPTTTSAPSAPTTISTINNPTTTNAPSAPTTISTDNNPTTTNAPSAPTTISTANNPTTINIISSPTTMEATTIVSTSGSLSSSTTVDTPTIVSTSGSLSSSTTVDTPTTPNSPVTTTGAPTTIASSTLGTITTGLPPTSTNAPPTNSPTIPTLTGILGGNTIKEFNSLLDKTRDREEVTVTYTLDIDVLVKPSVQTDTVDIEANTISGSIGTPEKVVELAARFGETSTTSAATTNTPVISTMTTPKPTTKATSTEKVSVVYPSTFLPNFITTFLSTLRPQGTTFGSTTGARTIVPTTTESFVNSPTTVKIPLTTVPVTTEAPKMTTPSTEPPMSTTPPPMTLPPTTMRLSTLQGGSVTATTEKRQTTTFSEIANTIISNFRGRIRFGDETTTVVVPTTKSIVTTIQPTENIIYTTSRSSSTTKRSIEQFNSPVYNAIPTVPPRTTTQKPTVQDTVVPSTVTVPSTTESLDEKVARLKNKKDLTEEQKENLRILMELENEQKALLKQLSFLTNFNLRGGANQNIPNLFGLAQEREETTVVPTTVPTTIRTTIRTVPTTTTPEPTTTTTTTTTTPPPTTTTSLKPDTTTISIEDLLAALGTRQPKFLGYPTNQPAVEDLLKQINANGLDKVTSSYGKSTDALLASLLKEQGIVPTTPKNLETLQLLIEAGTTTTTTTTRKPRPRTTPPPRPGRLMQGLNWLLNALVPPVDTTRPPRPRPVPTTTIRPTTVTTEEEELLSRAPTHISPVVAETVTTPSNSLGGLSQSEIQKLIAQLEAVQRDPKKLQTLDLTPLKNLQVNQKAKDVQVTNSGATGASGRLTERPSSIKLESAEPPYIRGRVAKATTPSGTESANSIRNEEKDTTLKPKVTLPPVKLRPVPGVPEEGGQVRSQLFNAAVNVTKAISSFLGSAIQDAVEQLKSMYGSAEVDAVLGIEPNTTQTP